MSSDSDETLQIYKVSTGVYEKTLASKKYGVKLAKFTHKNTSILYASTKENSMSLSPTSIVYPAADDL